MAMLNNSKRIQKTEVDDLEILSHVGEKHNRLTILKAIRKECGGRLRNYYTCKCECENIIDVRCEAVLKGSSKSCGCLQKDVARKTCIERNTTHGLYDTRLYTIWADMKARCYNPNSNRYFQYGYRGIKICDEWLKYDSENKVNIGLINFYNWAIENGYSDELTIDRIDPDGNYEPSNCRWSTPLEQGWNKHNNVYITYEQKFDEINKPPIRYTFPISVWSRITGISRTALTTRLVKHREDWTVEDALTTPTIYDNSKGMPKLINIGEYIYLNMPEKYDESIHD